MIKVVETGAAPAPKKPFYMTLYFQVVVAIILGGMIGLVSAYFGGKTDLITQRVLDILQGLPLLVLALVMSAALIAIGIGQLTPRIGIGMRTNLGS